MDSSQDSRWPFKQTCTCSVSEPASQKVLEKLWQHFFFCVCEKENAPLMSLTFNNWLFFENKMKKTVKAKVNQRPGSEVKGFSLKCKRKHSFRFSCVVLINSAEMALALMFLLRIYFAPTLNWIPHRLVWLMPPWLPASSDITLSMELFGGDNHPLNKVLPK